MMLQAWRFPLLACALSILASCTAGRSNRPGLPGTGNPSPVVVTFNSQAKVDPYRMMAAIPIPRPSSTKGLAEAAANRQVSLPSFDQRILAAHNRERSVLGLEPLTWDPVLAQKAQRWADYLAATGRFEHAPENQLDPEGENLWAGTKGYYSPDAQVDAWIREKRYFRRGTFPDNSTTGRVEDVGHYTQVVWRATTELGCGEAADAREDILVCRYAEPGNYRGEHPF